MFRWKFVVRPPLGLVPFVVAACRCILEKHGASAELRGVSGSGYALHSHTGYLDGRSCAQQTRIGTETPFEPAATTPYHSRIHGRPALPLRPGAVPFARYLNEIHRALHPQFADRYLASLSLGPRVIHALAEIVIEGQTGRLVQAGIIRTSGNPGFDAGVLKSLHDSFPVGPVPDEIRSVDKMVYLQWEFWDKPEYACSTHFARPYRLADKPSR